MSYFCFCVSSNLHSLHYRLILLYVYDSVQTNKPRCKLKKCSFISDSTRFYSSPSSSLCIIEKLSLTQNPLFVETGTMMTNVSGQMPPLMTGLRRWLAWESLLKSTQTSPITQWSVFVHHTFVLVATTNSQWWRSKHSCTIQQSPHHCQIHHFGHTPCTSRCHTVVTATCKTVQHVHMPCGKWSWMNWIVAKTQPTMSTCPAALWSTPVQTFCPANNSTTFWTTTLTDIMNRTEHLWVRFTIYFDIKTENYYNYPIIFMIKSIEAIPNQWHILNDSIFNDLIFPFFHQPSMMLFSRSLLPRRLVEEQSRLFGRILILDRWSTVEPQWCLLRHNDSSDSMGAESTNHFRSQELWTMERKVLSWRATSLLGTTLMQAHIKGCARRNNQFANMRQMSK